MTDRVNFNLNLEFQNVMFLEFELNNLCVITALLLTLSDLALFERTQTLRGGISHPPLLKFL
jgi:hypothetical protein